MWANLIASLLYLTAVVGVLLKRRWTLRPLFAAVAALLIAGVFLVVHIVEGGAYRTATIGALAFRTLLTLAFFFALKWATSRTATNTQQPQP